MYPNHLGRSVPKVVNTTSGGPRDLPFDLNYRRHPNSYSLPERAPKGERRAERADFAHRLVPALKNGGGQGPADPSCEKPAADRIAPARDLVDEVIAINGDFAWFALDPTFSPPMLKVAFRGNRARLRVQAWAASRLCGSF